MIIIYVVGGRTPYPCHMFPLDCFFLAVSFEARDVCVVHGQLKENEQAQLCGGCAVLCGLFMRLLVTICTKLGSSVILSARVAVSGLCCWTALRIAFLAPLCNKYSSLCMYAALELPACDPDCSCPQSHPLHGGFFLHALFDMFPSGSHSMHPQYVGTSSIVRLEHISMQHWVMGGTLA